MKTARDVLVCASLASPGNVFELDLFINGNRERAIAISKYGFAQGCRTVPVNAGDTVSVGLYHGSAAPITIQPNTYWNWLTLNQTKSRSETVVSVRRGFGRATRGA